MNFSLKPHPLIALWVPGLVVLIPLVLFHFRWSYTEFLTAYAGNGPSATVTILLMSIGSFLIGNFLDSLRDGLIELFLNWLARIRGKDEVDWDFFWKVSPDKTDQFDDYFFTYYVLNMNLSLALFLDLLFFWKTAISLLKSFLNLPGLIIPGGFFICILAILFYDAYVLRGYIARITTAEMKKGSEKMVMP